VYVYRSANELALLLRHPLQKKVVGLEWKPKSADVIAIACQSSVIIWSIDTKLLANSRVPLNCARIIDKNLPSPVTSIAYNSTGDTIAVCGPISWRIVLIPDDAGKEPIAVRHWFTGCWKLKWSPDGVRLLTYPSTTKIRMFENIAWSSAVWGTDFMSSYCQAACWSQPNGRFLLMAPNGSGTVYALTFLDKADANVVGGANKLIKALDLDSLEPPNGESSVGGSVHDMRWDKHAERLVISFKGM